MIKWFDCRSRICQRGEYFGMKKTVLSKRSEFFLLLIILIFSLTVKLTIFIKVYPIAPSHILTNDFLSYEPPARALIKTGRFTVNPDEPHMPETKRTPGYPVFIAAIYSIFGEDYLFIVIAQILISIGTILITYLVARTLRDPQTALLSALLLSMCVVSIEYSQLLQTETLFTFLLLIGVLYGIRLILGKGGWRKNTLFLGITLALATLVRPIGYYLIFPVLIGSFILGKMICRRWREVVLLIFLVALPLVVLVGGWQLRNFLLTGSPEFSHIKGITILRYKAVSVIAKKDNLSREEACAKILESLPDAEGMSQTELLDFYTKMGLSIIRHHPLICLRLAIRNVVFMMLSPGDNHFARYIGLIKKSEEVIRPWRDLFRLPFAEFIKRWLVDKKFQFAIFLFSMAHLLIVHTCASYSLWRIIRAERPALVVHIFILGVIIYFLIISTMTEPGARFRIPIMPLITIYAGDGLNRLLIYRRNTT